MEKEKHFFGNLSLLSRHASLFQIKKLASYQNYGIINLEKGNRHRVVDLGYEKKSPLTGQSDMYPEFWTHGFMN